MADDLLSYQPPRSARYHVEQRPLEPVPFVVCLLLSILALTLGAWAYLKILALCTHIALPVVVMAAAGICVGVVSAIPVHYGRVRDRYVSIIIGLLLSAWFLDATWSLWASHILSPRNPRFSFWWFLLHPPALFRFARTVIDIGSFTLNGNFVVGPKLVTTWIVEAVWILGIGTAIAQFGRRSTIEIICQHCRAKCKPLPSLPRFCARHESRFIACLEQMDYAPLLTFEAPPNENAPELTLRLYRCNDCGHTNLLNASKIAWSSKRTLKVVTTPLLQGQLLPQEKALELIDTCIKIIKSRDECEDDTTRADTLTKAS
jgi:hypothetical protein